VRHNHHSVLHHLPSMVSHHWVRQMDMDLLHRSTIEGSEPCHSQVKRQVICPHLLVT
jgi:hypothetical protein